jgi:GH18 family chitinase
MSWRTLRKLAAVAVAGCAHADAGLWNTAYYAGWVQHHLPAAEVDFGALTHVIHFAVVPNTDGSLDSGINLVTGAHSEEVVRLTRAAGTKALVSIGGANSAPGFRAACAAANLPGFIANITAFAGDRGYDGVDLDWEPLTAADAVLFANLVNGLRQAWTGATPRPLLTAAAATQPDLFAGLQHQFDQINLMMSTYYRPERYVWDGAACAAYLSIDPPGAAGDKFIAFDDPAACRAKVDFAARQGLGGVMIFELGGGYRPGEPAGRRDPLLQAADEAVRGHFRISRIHHGDDGVQITFSSAIGQAYRVEASDNLATQTWTSVARVTAADLATEVTVPTGPDPTRRFFRVAEDRPQPP